MNLKKFNVKVILGLLLTICLVVIIYLFNLYTNIKIDDYSYKFIYPLPKEEFKVRVLNFADITTSQIIHYYYVNGRYLTHVFVQYFLMLESKLYFDILNTIFLLLFILLVYVSLNENPAKNWIKFASFLSFLIFFYPDPSFTYTWLTGSINYTWTFVFNLAFILFILKVFLEDKKLSNLFLVFTFFLGLIAGAMHELASIAVFPSFIVTIVLIKKYKVAWRKYLLLLGNIGSSILLIFSPGNLIRATTDKASFSIVDFVTNTFKSLIINSVDLIPFFVFMIIVVYGFIKKKNTFSSFNPLVLFTIIFSLLNLVFIVLVQNFVPRAYYFINSFAIVCIFSFLNFWIYSNRGLFQILFSTFSISVLLVFLNIQRNFKSDFDLFESSVKGSNNNLFHEIKETKSRFLTYGLAGSNPYHWQNKIMSIYYGIKFFIIIKPEQAIEAENKASKVNKNTPLLFSEYVKLKDNQFLIPIPSSIDTAGLIHFADSNFTTQISNLIGVKSLQSKIDYALVTHLNKNNYLLLKVDSLN